MHVQAGVDVGLLAVDADALPADWELVAAELDDLALALDVHVGAQRLLHVDVHAQPRVDALNVALAPRVGLLPLGMGSAPEWH